MNSDGTRPARKRRPAKLTLREGRAKRHDGSEYIVRRIKGRGRQYLLIKTTIDERK